MLDKLRAWYRQSRQEWAVFEKEYKCTSKKVQRHWKVRWVARWSLIYGLNFLFFYAVIYGIVYSGSTWLTILFVPFVTLFFAFAGIVYIPYESFKVEHARRLLQKINRSD